MKYYVITLQQPYGIDAHIFATKNKPPKTDWYLGEGLRGPFPSYREAAYEAQKIEANNKCLQGEFF